MELVIRRYQHGDLEAVLDAWQQASSVAHPFLSPAFLAQERLDIPRVYLPAAETWVATRDGRVIGFVSLLGEEIGALFVQPAFHGTGAGRALMDKARELRGALEVEVFQKNAIGCRFYRRYGFEVIGDRTHEATGHPLWRMRLAGPGATASARAGRSA
ncbi:MAG: GNAT family N-acetyltransferase [Vicinamibacteria bacterium]|nr:GNAT family N-acetyltransferase [Vicinamibacteria bacterium]